MRIMKNRQLTLFAALLVFAGLVSACGSPSIDLPDEESPATALPAVPTEPPALPTEIPPTGAPPEPATAEPRVVVYEDPEGDCFNNSNVPAACSPPSVDILTVTISEESPLAIMIEVAEPGFDELRANGIFGVTFGIDVDRDPTTGNTAFWPDFHLMATEIELHWFEENGEVVAEGITHYAPDGTMTEGDASKAVWTVVDNTHLKVVLSEDLVTATTIGIAGDLFTPNLYDHFADEGYISYPEGEIVRSE